MHSFNEQFPRHMQYALSHQRSENVNDFVGSWYWYHSGLDRFVQASWKNVVMLWWGDATEMFQHGSPHQRSAMYEKFFPPPSFFISTSFTIVSSSLYRHYAVSLYNLPFELRLKYQFILLWMIVCGPNEPSSLQYIQKLMMDEIVESLKTAVGGIHFATVVFLCFSFFSLFFFI
jgi:hypothetical protein